MQPHNNNSKTFILNKYMRGYYEVTIMHEGRERDAFILDAYVYEFQFQIVFLFFHF
jgi:hypothetical protein